MDLYCPRCREPWDNDEFHDQAEADGTTYDEVVRIFRSKGCGAAFGTNCQRVLPNETISMIYDLMGDDTDGAASMFEDAAAMGLL